MKVGDRGEVGGRREGSSSFFFYFIFFILSFLAVCEPIRTSSRAGPLSVMDPKQPPPSHKALRQKIHHKEQTVEERKNGEVEGK